MYSRTQLLDHVLGGSVYVAERTVDVHIRRLPAALIIGIGVGAALGSLIGDCVAAGVAVAALMVIIFLVVRDGQSTAKKFLLPRGSRRFRSQLSVARPHRLITTLHDLRDAASQLPGTVALLNKQRRVRGINPAAETLLSYIYPTTAACCYGSVWRRPRWPTGLMAAPRTTEYFERTRTSQ